MSQETEQKNVRSRKPATKVIEISMGTIVRAILLIAGILFLYYIRDIVTIVLLSVVIASAAEPGIRVLGNIRIPRVLAVILIYLAAFTAFGVIFYLAIPPTITQIQNFVINFPYYLEDTLIQAKETFHFLPLDYFPYSITEISERLDQFLRATVSDFFSQGPAFFDGALSFILVVVVSFYLTVQKNGIENFLKIITPREHEPYVVDLWLRSQRKIGRWFQGQLILAVLVGILVYLGLTVLGVQYALILAIFAMMFEIIPVFGPIMAAIPSIAVATVQLPFLGLMVAILYILVQQLENHVIYPIVVRQTVGVPPMLVILALLVGAQVGGIMGIILSVPLAVVLVEFLNDVAKKKKLFEHA